MTLYRIFISIKKSHPQASLFLVFAWSRKVSYFLNSKDFKLEECKVLRDYLNGRRSRRVLTGRRDQLNWFLYGINHGVYVVDGVTRYTHC